MKRIKRIISLLLVCIMVVPLLPTSAFAAITPKEPAIVNGYYQIGTKEELLWFNNQIVEEGNLNINAELTNDIHLDGSCHWEIDSQDIDVWNPAEAYQMAFGGIFDGKGYCIYGLNVDRSGNYDGNCAGMFLANSGTIKNLGLSNPVIRGTGGEKSWSGAFCAFNLSRGVIQNCYVFYEEVVHPDGHKYLGDPEIYDDYCAGGICGYNRGKIENSYNMSYITGYTAGGICGENYYGTITNSYNVGMVDDWNGNTSYIGPILGDSLSVGAKIENCYYLNTCTTGSAGTSFDCTSKTISEFKSGEVCYNLNNGDSEGVWKQTLGVDDYPVFEGASVYYGGTGYTNTKPESPEPPEIPEQNEPKSYQRTGHLDTYDRNGSITIDGTKYTMTEEFKNSSGNVTPVQSGTYLDKFVYVAYNLNDSDQITAARVMYGEPCTLEAWDATEKVIDTSLTPTLPIGEINQLPAGNYKVSDAATSFPFDKMTELVGTQLRIYTIGQQVFKIIPVTAGEGLVTAYDDKSDPCTVTIDGKVYPLAKDASLLETIKDPFVNNAEYTKSATFILYDDILVELEYTNASFNEYIYRAETALDPHNEWYTSKRDTYLHGETPSETTVEICKDSGFATLAHTWSGVTTVFDSLVDSPSVGVKKVTLTQIDLYTAILLDSLECSFKSDIVSEAKKNTEDVRTEMGLVTSFVKAMRGYEETANINMNDIYGTLTKAEKDNIAAFVAADFRSSYGDIDMPADLISYLGTGFEVADTFETWLEEAVSYYKVLLLSQEMHEVIQTLYDECPAENWWMKQALENCVTVIDAGFEDFNRMMGQRAAIAAGEFAAIQITDFLWGKVSEGVEKIFPQVALVKVIYKAGKLLANELFNSDATAEAYYKLLALNNFQNLGRSVMNEYAADFKRIGTEEAAKIYLESVKLCWQIHMNGTQYTIDFYSAMHEGAMSGVEEWIAGASYDEIIADFKEVKSITELSKSQFDTYWIMWLSEDYPEIYPAYEYRLYETLELEKKIGIACPVDVSVYDENDVLVAYVKNGRPYASGNITAVVVGEEKYFYFYDDEQYKVVCDGYDTGTMDVLITEYDGDGVSRKVNYLDVPVSGESIHDLDSSTYKLSDRITQIKPDYDTSRAETKYTVRINNGFATTDSTFEYEFEAEEGQIIDINTHLPEGYRFDGWTCDNSTVKFDDPMSMGTSFVMVDEDITLTAVIKAIASGSSSGNKTPGNVPVIIPETSPYKDVDTNDYFYDAVKWAVENGITKGTSKTKFSPDAVCTRAQAVTFLWRAAGCPEPVSSKMKFKDVPANAYYYDAVLWATENGIAKGMGSKTFAPDAECTRGQIVTFLYRWMGTPAAANSSFKDVTTDSYCYDAVQWAVENGITKGMGKKTFAPDAKCTRAQIVTLLYRSMV